MLLKALQYHGFRAILNKWFALYLSNRPQFVLINGFNSNGFPQVSIQGPLVFRIHINDLYETIKYYKVHHIANNTNLLNFNIYVKPINK